MHEVGITQNLAEIAEENLRNSGCKTALSVTVAIGALSGVVAEAVEFCYEAVTLDSPLAGSKLIIDRIPGRKICLECQADFEADNQTYICPECGSGLLQITAGTDLRITEMEVE
jgi:hydrogenase nickel incorporation protein HypA/HybF